MIEPRWLQETLGPVRLDPDELQQVAAAMKRPAAPAVRLHQESVNTPLPFSSSPVPWHRLGRFVEGDARPSQHLEYGCGSYYIQDAGSLLAVALLDAHPGEWICDLCAAPGGKATAVVEALAGDGWLVANEPVHSRRAPLALNLARHGATRYVLSQADPTWLADHVGEIFDAVLIDAPCSGQSLVTRGKQSASAFGPRAVEHCAARQTRILDAAARLVRPGGRLVYSTCTFAYAENESQVTEFLERHSHWDPMPLATLAPWHSTLVEGCYRVWPHRDRVAGAFAARLVRGQSNDDTSTPRPRGGRLAPAPLPSEFHKWGTIHCDSLLGTDQQLFGWPAPLPPSLESLAVAGPEIAFRKHSTWFPAYALAMRRDEQWSPRQFIDLPTEDARRYLEGQMLAASARGWQVARHQSRPMGWIKADGRRAKNHLPKSARLVVARQRAC